MLRNAILATAVVALVPLGPALADNWKRIKSEGQFRALVVDKKSTSDNGWVTVKSNGTVVGDIKGQGKIVGNWAWGNGYWCRNINVGANKLGNNCQAVHVSGNKLRFTRDKGKGQESMWQLN